MTQNNKTYITVFNDGKVLANVELLGRVVYYAEERLIIQADNSSLFLATFDLPYFTVDSNYDQKYIEWSFECEGSYYGENNTIFWSDFYYPSAKIIQIG